MFRSLENSNEFQKSSYNSFDAVTLTSLQWMQSGFHGSLLGSYSHGLSYQTPSWWSISNPSPQVALEPPSELSPLPADCNLSNLVMTDPKRVSRALKLIPAKPEATKYTCKFIFYFLNGNKERYVDPRKVEYKFARDLARCVIGPRGENVRRIFQVNGGTEVTKLRLRGRGSGHQDCESQGMFFEADHEHLQLCVSVKGNNAYFIYTKVCAEIYDTMKVIIPDYNKAIFPGDPMAAFEITDQRVHMPSLPGSRNDSRRGGSGYGNNSWRTRYESPSSVAPLPPLPSSTPLLPGMFHIAKAMPPPPCSNPFLSFSTAAPSTADHLALLQKIAEPESLPRDEESIFLKPGMSSSIFPTETQGFLKVSPATIPHSEMKFSTFVPQDTPSPEFIEDSLVAPEDQMMVKIRATSAPPLSTYSTKSLMMSSPMWPSPGLNMPSSGLASIPNTPSPHSQIDMLKSLERSQIMDPLGGTSYEPTDNLSTALAATCSTDRVTPS